MSPEDREQLTALVEAVRSMAASLESIDARLATTLDDIQDKVAWLEVRAAGIETDVSAIANR